jgi:DNA-binding transcriptional regulator of glucitol operon
VYRFAWHPKWVLGHLLVLAAVITMIFLGHWQLAVSNRKHFSLQNFGYALQWWAFCLFALGFWAKILRDQAKRRHASPASQAVAPQTGPAAQEAYRRYVMPTAAVDETDPELARYNAYLAALAERDKR